MSIVSFFKDQIGTSSYRGSSDSAGGRRLAVAAGVTAASTAIGAVVGAQRQAADVVTHSTVTYPETETVQIGTHHETGGFHTHYSFSDGEFKYGYDPLWSHDEPDYETRNTGRMLSKDVAHHTKGFPNTVLSGALLGLGVGVALSVGYAALDASLNS